MRDGTEADKEYVRDILRYFVEHPQALDDLEGITRWRLLERRIQENLTRVGQALSWLVSKGLLVQEQVNTAHPVYRINPERRGDIERLLLRLESGKRVGNEK